LIDRVRRVSSRDVAGRRIQAFAALCAYGAASFLILGLAVARARGSWVVGVGGDSEIFVWSLAWWPHAISTGIDPLVTHAIWAPLGVNLAWVTSVPGAALLLWPLTASYGPVAAYDVAIVCCPALAAFGAYLLARELCGRFWPSLAGGWVFGFSSYLLGQSLGHLHVALVFPIPLLALQILRHLRGEIGDRRLVVTCGLLGALLISFSTELMLTTVVAGLLALALARVCLGAPFAPALRRLARPLAYTGGLAALLVSPLLIAALAGFETGRINSPFVFSADLANLVIPTKLTLVGGDLLHPISDRFRGNLAEDGSYLGLPLLVLCVLEARETWSRRASRIAPLCVAVALVCALGPVLRIAGVAVAPLPWLPLAYLPPFENILPVRLVAYAALAAGLCVASYLARRATPARIALVLLALAAPFPALAAGIWRAPAPIPDAVRGAAVSHILSPGEVVLALPFGGLGYGMLWQAEAGFRFRQAGGYLRPDPPGSYAHDPAVAALRAGQTPAPADFRAFLQRSGTRAILLDPAYLPVYAGTLDPLGITPERVGGLLVYRL
jgi:hypothetical protein